MSCKTTYSATLAIKSVSIRIEQEMLYKIGYIADYEGRSVKSKTRGCYKTAQTAKLQSVLFSVLLIL
ncbi:MAG: hypothetical protein Q4B31_00105 [Clostridia bacterium]|nr:hypothetical protein [Clostridia bacterium]